MTRYVMGAAAVALFFAIVLKPRPAVVVGLFVVGLVWEWVDSRQGAK